MLMQSTFFLLKLTKHKSFLCHIYITYCVLLCKCHVNLISCYQFNAYFMVAFYCDVLWYIVLLCCIISAIIEHTNQVIYLEDNDVAAVNRQGQLTIHRIRRIDDDPNASSVREIHTLRMQIQQIMKGWFFVCFVSFREYWKELCVCCIMSVILAL